MPGSLRVLAWLDSDDERIAVVILQDDAGPGTRGLNPDGTWSEQRPGGSLWKGRETGFIPAEKARWIREYWAGSAG